MMGGKDSKNGGWEYGSHPPTQNIALWNSKENYFSLIYQSVKDGKKQSVDTTVYNPPVLVSS